MLCGDTSENIFTNEEHNLPKFKAKMLGNDLLYFGMSFNSTAQ
jgi:hypothetical protein